MKKNNVFYVAKVGKSWCAFALEIEQAGFLQGWLGRDIFRAIVPAERLEDSTKPVKRYYLKHCTREQLIQMFFSKEAKEKYKIIKQKGYRLFLSTDQSKVDEFYN